MSPSREGLRSWRQKNRDYRQKMENCGAIAGTRRGGRDRHTDTVRLSQSQRQHQETEPEKVERDSGREEEKEDTCRCCDFQSQFSQTWAASPEILGKEEKKDKEMTDTARERMRQAETHR